MTENKAKEIWITPEDLENHIRSMNEKAEQDFNQKVQDQLRAKIEIALKGDKREHLGRWK